METQATRVGTTSAVSACGDDVSSVDTGLMQLSAAAEAARPMALLPTPATSPRHASTQAAPPPAGRDANSGSDGPDRCGGSDSSSDSSETQTTRVVQLITTKVAAVAVSPATAKETETDTAAAASVAEATASRSTSGADAGLPLGWHRVVHESGLPCFVNEELQVVTWTRPYSIDAVGGDFLTLAKTHVPPLSIFSRRDVGARHAQVLARRKPSAEDADSMLLRPKVPPQSSNTPSDGPNGQKKRKAEQLVVPPEPIVRVRRNAGPIPLVEVNGKTVESPEGKSVHAFLREFAMAMWKAVPQYTFTKTDAGSDTPVACSVRIHDKEYPTTRGSNKPVAKEAAAETVLEQHIPGYWMELKKQGRVGKYPLVPQPQSPPMPQIKEEPKKTADNKESTMTIDEFKTLAIGDSRVLQACMDLSIKTPAQVVQEYQNRHRGISVNYNTIPHESEGQKLFKTIVTAGSTVAEGIASTKKVAKQYAAQSLLVMLHQRSVKTYQEVADLYSRGGHGDLLNQMPLTVQTDPASARASPPKKARRASPLHNHAVVTAYQSGGSYARNGGGGRAWESGGYTGYDSGQNGAWQSRQDHNYGKKNERIVEYYSPNSGGYGGYYGAADEWAYNRPTQAGYSSYGPPPPFVPPGGVPAVPAPSAPYAPPQPPHASGPLPGYPYGDPRIPPYNRPKY